VKIFGRSLAHDEVLDIFRSTMHGGGHCENGAAHEHCDLSTGDGNFDYCDAATARQIDDLGEAHGSVGQAEHENSDIGTRNEVCTPEALLVADGHAAGLGRESPSFGVWDGHAVTACVEIDWSREITSSGLKFAAASSDEQVCGDDRYSCADQYCGTGGTFLVFVSGAQRQGQADFTTFHYEGTADIPVDTSGAGNNVDGQMLFDEMSFANGEQAVQYVAICRSGAGRARDNVLLDYVALRASGRDYTQDGEHCDPRPPPPPPPFGEAFTPIPYFEVNLYDDRSFTPASGQWRDVAGTGAVGTQSDLPHVVDTPLPKHFEFDGDCHFLFDQPEVFDFTGDYSVSVLFRPPPNLEDFHMLLSRRSTSDYLSHHHLFIDTRSTWVGTWPAGEPVAVLYMGGGNADTSVWAFTTPIPVGDYVHLTFTVSAGRICGFVNGVRSGDCSANIGDGNRQIGTGEPLEVGGEESYSNHPLWSLSSVMYYDRALSEAEVAFNAAASDCLEKEIHCP
jgi:hypothetical protein